MSESVLSAVFLSYAREDAGAARRVAEALRSSGLEVWFDENELRGGEEWDAKIRKQINDCTLFVPVISQQTEARGKGYFRLEWKLAVEQTHMLAEGVPFIAPVVIDDTRESGAVVPAEFLRVQWTRLPGALPTPQFVEQVKRLLAAPRKSVGGKKAETAAPTTAASAGPKSKRLLWAVAALAIAVMGLVAYFALRPAANRAKSIAVLPFVNMSSDKENEYLSDGITEEILNTLAKVPGLHVPARTSAFVFKGKTEDIKKIGELLHVATVLEGSVRKTGNQLRITAQLINVADGYHLWSETYDRDMTNIFAIQDDIARTIVAKLKLTFAGPAGLPPGKRRTENVEAYELVLQGRFHASKSTEPGLNLAISYFQQALAKQPDYALAYAGLAEAYGTLGFRGYVPPGEVTAKQRAAAAKALALDDTLAEAHLGLANIGCFVDWDWDAAERGFKRALELDPANVFCHLYYAYFLAVQGRHQEAIAEATKAQQLDPLSVSATMVVGWVFLWAGDIDRALAVSRQAIAMAPDFFGAHELSAAALFRKGQREEGIAQEEEARRIEPNVEVLGILGKMYGRVNRKADAQKVLEELLSQARQHYVPAYTIAVVYDGLGDIEQRNVWMNKAIAERESRLVFLKVAADDITRANPHYPEWLKKIGLDQ